MICKIIDLFCDLKIEILKISLELFDFPTFSSTKSYIVRKKEFSVIFGRKMFFFVISLENLVDCFWNKIFEDFELK